MKKKVLFVNHTSVIGGASWCLFEILKRLDRSRFEAVVLLTSDGPLVEQIRSLGISVTVNSRIVDFPVYGVRWIYILKTILFYPVMFNSFYKICRQINPDILYLNTTAQLFLPWPAKRAGVKKVILHNRELWGTNASWKIRHMFKNWMVSKFVDQIFSITAAGRESFGFSEKTIVVRDWPSFADKSRLDVRKELGIATDKFLILLAGGFQKIKGTADVICALEYMKHRDKVDVVVLGCSEPVVKFRQRIMRNSRDKQKYARYVKTLAASQPNVHLLPPTLQVMAYMLESDVLVAPFTMPHAAKAVLEAQLLGIPAIQYDSGPAREYIKNGITGFIISPGNIEELAAILDQMASEDKHLRQRKEKSMRFIETEFSAEKSMQLIENSFL